MYFRFMGSMDHDCNSVRVVHIFADTMYLKTRMRVYIEALRTMIAIMFELYMKTRIAHKYVQRHNG